MCHSTTENQFQPVHVLRRDGVSLTACATSGYGVLPAIERFAVLVTVIKRDVVHAVFGRVFG
jgi:hypothetical protein